MAEKLIILLVLLLQTIMIFLFKDPFSLAEYYLYFLILFTALNFLLSKKINLIQVWCLSFIFIILSEVFSSDLNFVNKDILKALKFLIISNNLIIFGYFLFFKKTRNDSTKLHIAKKEMKNTKFALPLLILVLFTYTAITFPLALATFRSGRMEIFAQDIGIFFHVFQSIALIFPAVVTYYFLFIKGKNVIYPLVFSLPIFILLFMLGSRFPLLFAAGDVLLIYYNFHKQNFSFLRTSVFVLIPLALVLFSSLVRADRGSNQFITHSKSFSSFPHYIAQFSSPEGVISSTANMMRYFESNEFLYGQSSTFLLYFWVPREIWPEKPTMLGHWLVRKTEKVSEFHSVSYGFTGELFSDFGYFSLFLVICMGVVLRLADNWKENTFRKGNFNIVLAAMLYPYIFFFIRSPITGTTTLLGIIIIYFMCKKIILKRPHNYSLPE